MQVTNRDSNILLWIVVSGEFAKSASSGSAKNNIKCELGWSVFGAAQLFFPKLACRSVSLSASRRGGGRYKKKSG